MRTIAWVPSPSLNNADFAIDDEVIFYAFATKTDKRLPLLSALLVAGAYAGLNMPFEIRNKGQEVLAVFEPGQPVHGYAAIVQALMDVAAHLDGHGQRAAARTVEKLKPEAIRLYEQGVNDGVAAERERVARLSEDGPGAPAPAEQNDAPASEPDAAPEQVALAPVDTPEQPLAPPPQN